MRRSPIEMMVDQACGFDPTADRTETKARDEDADTAAVMAACNAAVAWLSARETGSEDIRLHAQASLEQAARALRDLGW